jgi:hypothetical protein
MGTNVMGNVSVGNVNMCGYNLNKSNTSSNSLQYTYNNSFSNDFSYSSAIYTDGNGSFKPINFSIPRGFPKVAAPTGTLTVSKSAGLTLDISPYISNYDSVIVRFGTTGSTSTFGNPRKGISNNTSTVSFSSQELSSLYTGTYQYLSFMAYNYSNKMIDDKMYVFELSNKLTFYITITN